MQKSSPESTLSGLPGWLFLMGLVTALGPLAIDMYLPAFPAMARSLATTPGHIERTLAVYLLGMAAAQLFYGPMADRYGRKAPLVFGLSVFMVASAGCAFSQDISQLTAWRLLQAFGGAAGIVIPRAVIRDHFDTQDAARALSLLMLVMGATPILAPILGAQVLIWSSWRSIFHIISAIGAGLLIASVLYMRESLAPNRVTPLSLSHTFRNYRGLLRHRAFIGHTLAGGFGSAGMFTYIAAAPRVFIDVLAVDPAWFSLLFALNAAALIAAAQVSARLLKRRTPEVLLSRALYVALAASVAGLLLTLAGGMTLLPLMACLMTYMAAQGFINPNAAALALADQGQRLGVASAMMGTLQMLCGALAGAAISLWQTPSPLPLVCLLTVFIVLSWLSRRMAARAIAQTH